MINVVNPLLSTLVPASSCRVKLLTTATYLVVALNFGATGVDDSRLCRVNLRVVRLQFATDS